MYKLITGLLLCCAPATADVVVFDNTGGVFEWAEGVTDGPPLPENTLDITRDASQNDRTAPHGLGRWYSGPSTSWDYTVLSIMGLDWDFVQVARDPIPVHVLDGKGFDGSDIYFLQMYDAGNVIGPGADWTNVGIYWVGSAADSHHVTSGYFGAKIQLQGQTHFGWVQLDVVGGSAFVPPTVTPLRWAYETTPNTPIAVPGPSAAAILGGGLVIAGLRRRRW